MGRRSLIISIGVIIFAVIFIVLFLLSRLTAPSDKNKKLQNAKEAQAAVKTTISTNDIISDPLVYDGLIVDVETQIIDWVTKRVFAVNAGTGGLLRQTGQLLVISKTPFMLPKDIKDGSIGLGETVNVRLTGRVRIMDRVELERALGLPLDGEDIKLDDNSLHRWKEGSVLLLHSIERL